MVVHAEVAEKLERELIDFQKGMFSACSGYIGATEVAGKAIVAMEQALKAGIAHSRRRMEESLPRLKKELSQCRLDHQGPVHINSNVRLFDLVRFMRTELHQAELITDEEYSWLCAEAELATAPEGGSPSPRRLEDYDDLRKLLTEKNAQIVALRESLQYLYDATSCTDLQYKTINEALSTPPPAVVPLEDVRPLVDQLQQYISAFHRHEWDCGQLEGILSIFTAKHPL